MGTIIQAEVDAMARDLHAIHGLLRRARRFAYALLREGNHGAVLQLAGSAAGTADATKMTEDFLRGLADIHD